MTISTLFRNSIEDRDTPKVLAHYELLFLTFVYDSTYFGSDFRSGFMYKFILEPFFINLGAATTFYDSKLQDNSNLLGVGFTLHISNMLPQESQVSFGPDMSLILNSIK